MSLATVKFLDFSDEVSTVSFNVATPSGGAYDWDGLETSIAAVREAMAAVSLCTRSKEQVNVETDAGSGGRPSDEQAQRELGLRIFYQDATTLKKYHVTIPGPDASLMASPGFDIVDWSGTEMAALQVAFEANVLSETGNAVNILTGKIVGRRN